MEKVTVQQQILSKVSERGPTVKKAAPLGATTTTTTKPTPTPKKQQPKLEIIEETLTHDLFQKTLQNLNLQALTIQHPWNQRKHQRPFF
jgi:hypothetical protein